MNIIFVCTGNTCRSPMAQGYLESKKIPWLNVISRGIYADGSAVSVNSADAMEEIGIDIKKHISAPLTKEDIKWADRIICLSPNHYNILSSMGIGSKKLSVLGEGISDPFGWDLSVYRKCRDEIIEAVDELFEKGFFSLLQIIPIEERHIGAIAKLEKVCFSEPWSAETLLDSYKRGTKFFVAENEKDILGYIGFSAVAGEGYITNVAVFPKYRRMGVGTAIVNEAVSYCKKENLEFLSLEVRKSNDEAIRLYEKSGFKCVGERKDFYRNPKENALIMTIYFK
ncbi:MAG: ribosomal protein S18-alanine N-acetyltransferase [Acutalibacteraceae bacterium]|nr:ribosomal protein S18-alanine N-acetyltransferase [Acutalibacteraceae bacterium]